MSESLTSEVDQSPIRVESKSLLTESNYQLTILQVLTVHVSVSTSPSPDSSPKSVEVF